MKHIYLVRHCKAAGQAPDAPLTELGVQQADQLASFLSDKAIDSIISSPFERAVRTIKPFADKQGLDIVRDDRLTERVLSDQDLPDWYEMLRKTFDDLDLSYAGGESSRFAMNRVSSVVADVLNGPQQRTVIVSHGNLISLLLKHFDDRIGFKEWEALSNPDVYLLTFEDDSANIQRIWMD
ncbi:histidine phosphatase family protein [Brevibacillus choshinensis]|uniref:Histidine phosphatase family protein n=1 Tax=Brevibacillus choshinensis TaxID=54911 RepID=A0ABX7FT69_BRECH|nr:histidine phosphatase family protein [Brevibacillus choshinensis]QRG68467.1 histidine phosphatase family protein [Brevibacillus choshinensis]